MSQTPSGRRSFALRANILVLRVARHWLRVALVIIGLYVSLPFAAPILMHVGATGPAQAIYTLYSPFCHQFAFRSFFLFGEQIAYPRAAAGTTLKPFESYIQDAPEWQAALQPYLGIGREPMTAATFDPLLFTPQLQFAARAFHGDPQMGYKLTLCERDISIYLAMLTGGLLYSIPYVRRRLRPVPIWLYVLLGIAPIGLDGFSQLLGYPPFNLWPMRETTPTFRVVTGALFGFMNAWLAFPYLELSFRETRQQIEAKLGKAGIHI